MQRTSMSPARIQITTGSDPFSRATSAAKARIEVVRKTEDSVLESNLAIVTSALVRIDAKIAAIEERILAMGSESRRQIAVLAETVLAQGEEIVTLKGRLAELADADSRLESKLDEKINALTARYTGHNHYYDGGGIGRAYGNTRGPSH